MPKAPAAKIDPSSARIRLRLGQWFDFKVDGKSRIDINWSLVDPITNQPSQLGKLSANRVEASPEPRQSYAVLRGQTSDKKFSSSADVYAEIEWEWASPVPVDDWSFPVIAEGIPWNTQKGRRAWLIMMDVLFQLPDKFLKSLEQVYLVRAKELIWGYSIGLHWPFDRRAVLIANSQILRLKPDAKEITKEDISLAQTFVHELAHVVLANKAFQSNDRFWNAFPSLIKTWASIPIGIITMPLTYALSPLQVVLGIFRDQTARHR
jgi:hypothetical protein